MIVKINNYPEYTISNTGVVYNRNGLALKYIYRKSIGKSGRTRKLYPRVSLYKNNKSKWYSVHRLVAIHFIPNPKNLRIVHHKDNNPQNPHHSNLQWVTNAQNIQKAYDDGLISTDKKKKSAHRFGDGPGAVPVEITHKQTGEKQRFDSIRRLQHFLNKNSTVSIQQAIREPHRTVNGFYIRKVNT